jgi:predicted nuclease of predicted toxin-antitoxin system
MSRPRFLADHDLNEHIITGLLRRDPSFDVVRCRDLGLADQPDAAVLEFAANHGRVVVSHDVNTMPMHAKTRMERDLPMVGLLMVRQTSPVGVVIEDLLLVAASSSAEEWHQVIVFLPFA